MAQAVEDTTSLQPSAHGLPEPEDRIVRELDVYLCNGELGAGTQASRLCQPGAAAAAPPAQQ